VKRSEVAGDVRANSVLSEVIVKDGWRVELLNLRTVACLDTLKNHAMTLRLIQTVGVINPATILNRYNLNKLHCRTLVFVRFQFHAVGLNAQLHELLNLNA